VPSANTSTAFDFHHLDFYLICHYYFAKPGRCHKDAPRDQRHQVDRVEALDEGHIEPRPDLLDKGEMTLLDLDIMMKNTPFMPWVKFSHLRSLLMVWTHLTY